MTPPRHQSDDDLRAYLDSTPPSAEESDVHDRLAARLDSPTGIHDLRELKQAVQSQAIEAFRERLAIEREKRLRAEAVIRGFWKWLAGILAGVLVVVIAALILGKKP
jgi:hypothetical protein